MSGSVIGLNLVPVLKMLDMYEIEDKKHALILIQKVFSHFQEEHNLIAKVTDGGSSR